MPGRKASAVPDAQADTGASTQADTQARCHAYAQANATPATDNEPCDRVDVDTGGQLYDGFGERQAGREAGASGYDQLFSFYMGKYEVTQAQWNVVMNNDPSHFKGCVNCPVEGVSWDDAQSFINKLNEGNDGFRYRLRSEAEWEYACRAGTTGDYAGNLSDMAWYSVNSLSKTHAVGGREPNGWGLADMHGNVWEWCEDSYHETYYGEPNDGSAWLSAGVQKYRVLRGGSWVDPAPSLRSANRDRGEQADRDQFDGFRVVAVVRTR